MTGDPRFEDNGRWRLSRYIVPEELPTYPHPPRRSPFWAVVRVLGYVLLVCLLLAAAGGLIGWNA